MISPKVKSLNIIRSMFKVPVIENALSSMIRSESRIGWFASKLAPNNYQYKANTIRRTDINGLNFKLDISDYVGHFLYFGFKDLGFEELIRKSEGKKIIFDVGANIGFTALNMAKINGNSNTVYAFEPDPYNFSRLEENIALNPQTSVDIQNIGLGDKPAKLKLAVITPDNFGGNRIADEATDNFNWVNITTIDSFCIEKNIQRIDLIKVDVEGFDINVLKGGKEMIEMHKPVLFVEVDDNNLNLQNSSAKELIGFIEEFYPNIYNAETKQPIKSSDDFSNCHFDVVAHV